MPVSKEFPAPYAPSGVIVDLIERYRQKGLPEPIGFETLSRAGVSESLIPRSLYALKILDLVDNDGKPTPVFEGLRLAPETEYKAKMAAWLSAAYADALSFVDPASSDATQIRDAFRSYKPFGQQDRMVSLFIGLFQAAGVIPDTKKLRPKPAPKNVGSTRRSRSGGEPLNGHKPAELSLPPRLPPQNAGNSINARLLEKFPAFDPDWSDEIKAKWFDGYEKLLAISQKE